MSDFTRRKILKASAGLAAGALLPAIRKAQAIPAAARHRSIEDVGHIVVLMQENRSFDHYFGAFQGARGFADRFPAPLPSGRPVWYQTGRDGRETPPFHLDVKNTDALSLQSLDHSWKGTHQALNGGRHDGWIAAKSPLCMGSFDRSDLPFHYALADAFTLCDAYFASHPGSTRPNRLYMMTGQIDPLGIAGGPVTEQPSEEAIFRWDTYPEMLERAGISWLIYQGTDADGPYPTHPGDYPSCYNELLAFPNYRTHGALMAKALAKRTLRALADDVARGTLPQMSWILPPYMCSEHPSRSPLDGAAFISGVIDILSRNPDSWSKTALFVTYDENDGFFDHIIPPFPAPFPERSTVATCAEFDPADGLPYGLGVRVPMLVVSPWSRGGLINSQIFDHSSIIQFAEKRFGVVNPNISCWRRAVCGDLTSAFDFARPNDGAPRLPPAPVAPRRQGLPQPEAPQQAGPPEQEPGHRASCPLPYCSRADSRLDPSGKAVWIDFANMGLVGACFTVFSTDGSFEPRCYTLEPGKALSGRWDIEGEGAPYQLMVHGANGFYRLFSGITSQSGGAPPLLADVACVPVGNSAKLQVTVCNRGSRALELTLADLGYGQKTSRLILEPYRSEQLELTQNQSDGWYDVEIVAVDDPRWRWRCAGHLETGQKSITDPAMGKSA